MDDIDRIMAVMEEAFDPAYGEGWTRKQVMDALTLPGTHYLLVGADGAEPGDGTAAGFAMSRAVLDEEELLLLAVLPKYRRRGLGDRLVARFIAEASGRGARRLFLEMRDGNSAEALYRRYGFASIARRRHYYRRGAAGPLDAITFALDIPAC